MIRVAIESTVQEFRIADNCLKQFFRITGVGQITSAFSCNIDLFAQFFIFFKQMDFAPSFCRIQCCKHACRPSAYHCYFLFHL